MITFNFIVFAIVILLGFIYTLDRVCTCIERCVEEKHKKTSIVDILGLSSNKEDIDD